MTIKEFVEAYKAKKFMNTKQGVDERMEWIKNQIDVKKYIPFKEKREIAEMIVEENIEEIDGIKKYDSINGYISLIIASITIHTSLQFGDDPIEDYDLLAESGLLQLIVSEFQESYDEIDIILKMALSMELEDNNVNVLIAGFLNKTFEILKDVVGKLDLNSIFDANFEKEDLAKLVSLLDKNK